MSIQKENHFKREKKLQLRANKTVDKVKDEKEKKLISMVIIEHYKQDQNSQ